MPAYNDPRLIALRKKCIEGTITQEEYKEAIAYMREGRVSAHITSTKKRAAPIDAGAILDDFFSLESKQ